MNAETPSSDFEKKESKIADSAIVHETAIIESPVIIQSDVRIWHFSHVRSGAKLDKKVSLARDVYIDEGVHIKTGTRIQNGVSVYKGVDIDKWCFVGPHTIFTNDYYPRAGSIKWNVVKTTMHPGASIGAGSVICCGVTIGAFAMVGAGSIVTQDVPPFSLVFGNPAKVQRKICACGDSEVAKSSTKYVLECCHRKLNKEILELAHNF